MAGSVTTRWVSVHLHPVLGYSLASTDVSCAKDSSSTVSVPFVSGSVTFAAAAAISTLSTTSQNLLS